ncbi:MAG: MalY/PatB family protein [Atopobiaceae bacterium]|jgi:cystathionine beta-lyase|nr:pyridoxal phosphate-dependent aminotransferase [Atopobiaceae bacterium]
MARTDFSTRLDRRNTGSVKWDMMASARPSTPPGVVPFSVADMELDLAPEIREALGRVSRESSLGYVEPTDAYFDAVIGWQERRHGWHPQREWICLSPGVVPAVYNAVRAFTRPGDGVIVQTPAYYPFFSAIEANGRTVVRNPLLLDGSRYRMDFDGLESLAADPRSTMLILCSPHNPVGRVWTKAELRRVADICLSHEVLLVCDEIHGDLVMPGFEQTTLMNVLEPSERPRAIVCTAPSKTFNLAGCQCSNIFVPDPTRRQAFLDEFGRSAIGMLNAFAFPACIAAYERCEGWLDELLDLVSGNASLVAETCDGTSLPVTAIPLEGTYLQWLDCRRLRLGPAELEAFMQDANLFFDEGHLFGPEGDGFERMNLAAPRQVVAEGLGRLQEALARQDAKGEREP